MIRSNSTFEDIQRRDEVEAYIERLGVAVTTALTEQNMERLDWLLKRRISTLITAGTSLSVLFLVERMEPFYREHPSYLAEFYCIKGHIFHFAQRFKEAERYYKHCISYGVLYEKYGAVAAAMTNLVVISEASLEEKWAMARAIPLINLASPSLNRMNVFGRFLYYAELSIKRSLLTEAEQIITYVEENFQFPKRSRKALHLLLVKALLAEQQQQIEAAHLLYYEVLSACIQQKLHFDYLQQSYEAIVRLASSRTSQLLPEPSPAQFLFAEQAIETYLPSTRATCFCSEQLQDRQTYQQIAQHYNREEVGSYSVLLFDVRAAQLSERARRELIVLLDEQMAHYLDEYPMSYIMLNKTTLLYVVACDEHFAYYAAQAAHRKMEQLYGVAHVADVYFAVVHNEKHFYSSFEACLNLARAYIYYEHYQ